jgi:hypothetical protein
MKNPTGLPTEFAAPALARVWPHQTSTRPEPAAEDEACASRAADDAEPAPVTPGSTSRITASRVAIE